MSIVTVKEKEKGAFTALKGVSGYKNKMQTPHMVKVVVSAGTGSTKDKKKVELIADRLSKITGQKVALRSAKVAIATFKSRKGDPVGYQITLRGARMYDFLDRLLNISIPRTKDFRGLSRKGIDDIGNYTIGIKENTIFPETADEELKDVFGFAVTLVTTAKDKKSAEAFLQHIGVPFQKEVK